MQRLRDLFNKYGSDKDHHEYTPHYDSILKNLRDKPISLPGYAPGGSLRAWRDYFSKGLITGVDVQPDTQFVEDRIKTHLASSTDKDAFDGVLGKDHFDVIVDDGSHESNCNTCKFMARSKGPGILYYH